MKQKGFAPILIIFVIAVLGVIGYLFVGRNVGNPANIQPDFLNKAPSPSPAGISDYSSQYPESNCHSYDSLAEALKKPEDVCQLYLGSQNMKEIPDNFVQFKNIKVLSLYNNELSRFPSVILDLTTLEVLDISANNLTSLPENIDKLKNLKRLIAFSTKPGAQYFRGDYFTSLPSTIGNLTDLEYLDLDENGISSLPDSFWNLSKLKYLILYGNKLSKIDPRIGQLKSLIFLDLEENNIVSVPEEIGNLINLKQLALGAYSFDSSDTREVFPNKISVVPGSIGNLAALENLDLNNLPLKVLPPEIKNLKNLRDLDIIRTQISQQEVDDLKQALPNCSIHY